MWAESLTDCRRRGAWFKSVETPVPVASKTNEENVELSPEMVAVA